MKFFKKIFDHEYKELEKFKAQADLIMAKDEEMSNLSDKELMLHRNSVEIDMYNGVYDYVIDDISELPEVVFSVVEETLSDEDIEKCREI